MLTDEQLDAVTLWVAHTHAVDGAHQTPYLNVTSAEKQCGKSRLLEVLTLIGSKTVLTANQSVAAVYRLIDKLGTPTLLMDEVDAIWTARGDENEALRGIINAGNVRGVTVHRCENFTEVVLYRVFCPKVLAGIGRLPDTIADRSVPIRMQRKTRDEGVERFRRRRVEPDAKRLRGRLEEWARTAVEALFAADPDLPDQLSDRQQDAVEPLLAIANLAGPEWGERAAISLVALLASGAEDIEESLPRRCLSDCRDVFDSRARDGKLFSAWLVTCLRDLQESPWPERDLTAHGLGFLLRRYGIRSKKIRIGDDTFQGYRCEQFEDAWRRYLPERHSEPAEG